MTSMSPHVPHAFRRAMERWRPGGRAVSLMIVAPVVAFTAATLPAASAVAAQTAPTAVVTPTGHVGLAADSAPGALTAPDAVPAPPSGWSTVFSDDFNGAAGSGADSQWMYDTGPGSNFGTGEIETMTNSTSNGPQSGKCLDDTGYGGPGTQLQIWDCTGNANQQWNLP